MRWLSWLRMTRLSVPMTRVYNNSRRSIQSDILLHFACDLTFSFVCLIPAIAYLYGTMLTLILAAVIAIIWRPHTLACRKALAPA